MFKAIVNGHPFFKTKGKGSEKGIYNQKILSLISLSNMMMVDFLSTKTRCGGKDETLINYIVSFNASVFTLG